MIIGQTDFTELLAFGDAVNLSYQQVFEALLVAFVLSLVVASVYRISVGDRVVSPAMQGSLVLLAMVGAMVMMVIGNNIARAFSLVGALAIVRFRTRLRSPWDISFAKVALEMLPDGSGDQFINLDRLQLINIMRKSYKHHKHPYNT